MPSPHHHDPDETPTANAAEHWLREIAPLLDAIARYLYPATVGRAQPSDDSSGPEAEADDAALAEYARARASLPPARRATRFSVLTACPGGHTRGDATRPCRHAHVEVLIEAVGWTGLDGPRYAVRVVNVDLPRWRHRDAFIAPAPTWPDRGEAAAAGLRLARERWGEVAVVHSTPSLNRTDAATDRGCA